MMNEVSNDLAEMQQQTETGSEKATTQLHLIEQEASEERAEQTSSRYSSLVNAYWRCMVGQEAPTDSGEPKEELVTKALLSLRRVLMQPHAQEIHKSLNNEERPFGYKFVEIRPGKRVGYKEWKKGTAGDMVMLMLHRGGMCAEEWNRVGKEMCDAGYRIIAMDLQGHGRNVPHHVNRRGGGAATRAGHSPSKHVYSCESLVTDALDLIVALDLYTKPICVMGVGIGAVVALALAAEYPKLVGGVGILEFGIPLDCPYLNDSRSIHSVHTAEIKGDVYVLPWWSLPATLFWNLYDIQPVGEDVVAACLQSPISSYGPIMAQRLVEFSRQGVSDARNSELRRLVEAWCGDAGACQDMARALTCDTLSSNRKPFAGGLNSKVRVDPEFFFHFDVGKIRKWLQSLSCHVFFSFGDMSSHVARQDVCSLANLCTQAKSVTVEELSNEGPNFVRDGSEQFIDCLIDFLVGPALDCFSSPQAAWERTPANLGLRPLPEYSSVEEAQKALGPRKIPTPEAIEEELRKLRVEEGRSAGSESDEDDAPGQSTGARTALSHESMDYFGFIG